MNIILIAVIACCLVSIIFSIINKKVILAYFLIIISTAVTFAVAIIQATWEAPIMPITEMGGLAVALVTCFLAFSCNLVRRNEVATFGSGFYYILWAFLYFSHIYSLFFLLLLAGLLLTPLFFSGRK